MGKNSHWSLPLTLKWQFWPLPATRQKLPLVYILKIRRAQSIWHAISWRYYFWRTQYMIIGVKSLLRCYPATSDSFDIDEYDAMMQHWRHKELCDERSTPRTVTMVTERYQRYTTTTKSSDKVGWILGKNRHLLLPPEITRSPWRTRVISAAAITLFDAEELWNIIPHRNSDYVSEHLIDDVVHLSQENRIWNKRGPNNIYCWRHIYSWQIGHVVVKLKITNGKVEIMLFK